MRFCLYAAQAGKPWNGETLYTEALGGSETAVVYMARELARLGHEVVVFARGEPGVFDDVLYLPFESARTYLLLNSVDVLVCSRDASPIQWGVRAACSIYWSHDLPQQSLPPGFDLYFFVSQWQANVYGQLGFLPNPEKVRISPNGIDRSLFSPSVEQRTLHPDGPVRLVWTSNPDRGLWYAGAVLQRVRQVYPHTELHVYGRSSVYGWPDDHEHVFHPDQMEGVILHEALPKAELAKALANMDLFIYPTWWGETFCISGLEAQAAGVPVVATELGALPETVRGGVLVRGPVNETLDQFSQTVIDLLDDTLRRDRLAQVGIEFASHFDWKDHAKRWSDLFSKTLGYVA